MDDHVDETPALNRAGRRSEARRARKLAALGSGMVLATSAAGMLATTAPAGAATITVTSLDDSGPGTLRQALADANDGDTIDLTGLTGTITLTSGQLEIEDVVTITGPGADVLTISGNGTSRVFNMRNGLSGTGTVTISSLTVADGNVNGAGAGINFDCDSASNANLVLADTVFTGNSATALGGAIYFDRCEDSSLTISNSVVVGNVTTDGGGGIWFDEGTTMTVVDSTISGNQAQDSGGGGITFDEGDALVIRNSTVAGNSSGADGGGLYLTGGIGSVTITNSTIADNSAPGNGGGIILFDRSTDVAILQSTISGNVAGADGDGIYFTGYSEGNALEPRANQEPRAPRVGALAERTVALSGTIVAGNADGTDEIAADGPTTVAATASVIGGISDADVTIDDQGGTQLGVTNPGLAPLADNGGPTQTMALLPGSVAIDAGPDPVADFPGNEDDQRGPGYPRVVNGRVDVGAFEVQPVVIEPTFTG